jgi:hypothetical protein
VFYYAREELKEGEREFGFNSGFNYTPEILEEVVDKLIKQLEKYDGDRCGYYAPCPQLHRSLHEAEVKGTSIYFT